MQSVQLLINKKYSATTQAYTSGLDLQNDYYVYINKNGGGIVNFSNVRGYLNDIRNQQITQDFFAYLTGSTSQDQALNIISSDKKLSDVFNDYYQRVIISGNQFSSTAVIQSNLTGSTQNVAYTYDHNWDGYSPIKYLTGITQDINNSSRNITQNLIWQEFTNEESYYVPVYIERGTNQIARNKYDVCNPLINPTTSSFYPEFSSITNSYFSNIVYTGNTRFNGLINCFVDLNLETNENVDAEPPLLSVGFAPNEFGNFAYFNIAEGSPVYNYTTSVSVKVKLSQPSLLGIEEATINLYAANPSGNTLNPYLAASETDFISDYVFPLTLTWAIGEQEKILSFTAKTDFEIEETESFFLQISNVLNVNPGTLLDAEVSIADTTILRYASLQINSTPTGFDGIGRGATDEGNDFELIIFLDGPATGGETVTINQVPTISTPNVTLGPASNPLLPSDYTVNYYPTYNTILYNQTFPKTVTFLSGETSKTFNVWIKENNVMDLNKIGYFEISNAHLAIIDQSKKIAEVTVFDNEGQYRYLHLNLGTIYSEFGNSQTNTLMRQINPSGGPGGYNNIYVNQYANYLIKYNSIISFQDYSMGAPTSIAFDNYSVKAKITNLGQFQSIVNNITILTGQTVYIDVASNNFILTATTNGNLNNSTGIYENGIYKIELVTTYSAVTASGVILPGMDYKLRNLDNITQSNNNTINLGSYSFSGLTTVPYDTTSAYKLFTSYSNVNTARITGNDFFGAVTVSCPTVSSTSASISFNEFNASKIENISLFGIILLNYNDSIGNPGNGGLYGNYTSNYATNYSGVTFVGASATQIDTCPQTTSIYNGLPYISIPFYVAP